MVFVKIGRGGGGACEPYVFFWRVQAVIKFVLRAASTLKNTTSEQRNLNKFSANFTHRLISPVRQVP